MAERSKLPTGKEVDGYSDDDASEPEENFTIRCFHFAQKPAQQEASMQALVQSDETRGGDRYPIMAGGRLRVGGGGTHPFAVTNLSTTGFRGECDRSLPVGAQIAVELPELGFVHAWVRWSDSNTIGGEFRQPLAIEDCRRVLMPRPERLAAANDAWLRAIPA